MALIAASLAVLAYRATAPDWRGVWALAERRPSGPPRLVAAPEPPAEVVAAPRAEPVPTPVAESPPKLAVEAVPTEPAPSAAAPPAPSNAEVARAALVDRERPPEPEPEPEPKAAPPAVADVPPGPEATDRARLGIEREVHRRRAESEVLADVKRRALDDARDEAKKIVVEGRATFRAEVATLLQNQGRRAGPAIWALCRTYRGPGRFVPRPTERDLWGGAGGDRRARTRARVERLRALGVAEPVILADLFRTESLRVRSRYGPRDRDEAVVLAARALLDVPLPDEAGPAGP